MAEESFDWLLDDDAVFSRDAQQACMNHIDDEGSCDHLIDAICKSTCGKPLAILKLSEWLSVLRKQQKPTFEQSSNETLKYFARIMETNYHCDFFLKDFDSLEIKQQSNQLTKSEAMKSMFVRLLATKGPDPFVVSCLSQVIADPNHCSTVVEMIPNAFNYFFVWKQSVVNLISSNSNILSISPNCKSLFMNSEFSSALLNFAIHISQVNQLTSNQDAVSIITKFRKLSKFREYYLNCGFQFNLSFSVPLALTSPHLTSLFKLRESVLLLLTTSRAVSDLYREMSSCSDIQILFNAMNMESSLAAPVQLTLPVSIACINYLRNEPVLSALVQILVESRGGLDDVIHTCKILTLTSCVTGNENGLMIIDGDDSLSPYHVCQSLKSISETISTQSINKCQTNLNCDLCTTITKIPLIGIIICKWILVNVSVMLIPHCCSILTMIMSSNHHALVKHIFHTITSLVGSNVMHMQHSDRKSVKSHQAAIASLAVVLVRLMLMFNFIYKPIAFICQLEPHHALCDAFVKLLFRAVNVGVIDNRSILLQLAQLTSLVDSNDEIVMTAKASILYKLNNS